MADPAQLRSQAEQALEAGRLRRATGLLRQLTKLEPNDPGHHLDLGRVLYRRSKHAKALPCLERACKLAPAGREGLDHWMAKGDCLQALERYQEALAAYDEALECQPLSAVAWNNRGFTNFSMGRFNEALRCYDEALELAPSYQVAWYNRGYTLQIAGQLNEARRYYERAVQLEPEDHIAWNNLGNVYYNQGHYERSIDIFKRSLESDPEYVVALNNIGNALDHLHRYHESLGYHQRAIDLDPTFHYAWMAKGRALTRLGQPEEGLELIETAIELEESDADYHVALGDTLAALDRPQAAKAAYNQALNLNPGHGEAWEGLAGLAQQEGDTVQALRYYDQTIRALDSQARSRALDGDWLAKAGALERAGLLGEALNQYHNALVTVPLSARSQLGRGRLLEETDRPAEALEAYRAAQSTQGRLVQTETGKAHSYLVREAVLGQARCLHALERTDEGLALLEGLASEFNGPDEAELESGEGSPAESGGQDEVEATGEQEAEARAEGGVESEAPAERPPETPAEATPGRSWWFGRSTKEKPPLPTLELSRLEGQAATHGLRGELLAATGDMVEAARWWELAAAAYEKLAEKELELLPTRTPDHHRQAAALTEAALCHRGLGRTAEALEQAEAALRLASDDLVAWLLVGELYLALDQPGEAGEAFDGALGVDPHDEAALTGRARAHLAAGHQRLALELARAAARSAPDFAPAWEALQAAAQAAGHEEEQRRAKAGLERLEQLEGAQAKEEAEEGQAADTEAGAARAAAATTTEDPTSAPSAPSTPAPAADLADPTATTSVVTPAAAPAEISEVSCPSCGAVSPAAEVLVENEHCCPACGATEEGWAEV